MKRTRENLDAICGGREGYRGLAWARKFYLPPTTNPNNCSSLLIQDYSCRGPEMLIVAAASSLHKHGLLPMVAKLLRNAIEDRQETQLRAKNWLGNQLTRLLPRIKCSAMRYTRLDKRWNPFAEGADQHDMVVAELRGHKHLYVSIAKKTMQMPGQTQWLAVTEENLQLMTGGTYRGICWAFAFGGDYPTAGTKTP